MPPTSGGLSEGKESTTPLTAIRNTELWNTHDGVIGVYPWASKYLGDHQIKIQAGINGDIGTHMEATLLASKLLGKCGVFWSHLAEEIEKLQMHLVNATYREDATAEGRADLWTMVLPMVRVIWMDLGKVRLEAETDYGSKTPAVIVGHYLWETLQNHRVMDNFMRTHLGQHQEVPPHITLYMLEHRAPQVEVLALKKKLEEKAKTLIKMEKTCKELR